MIGKNSFSESESDFYEYLTKFGNVNRHSRTNYMSWLTFLSMSYDINDELTEEKIQSILESERKNRIGREIYKNEKDVGNFRSALRKYVEFLNFGFLQKREQKIQEEIKTIENSKSITKTEREAIVSARIGQGDFRKKLIAYWQGCSISHIQKYDILIASHIKPWRDADNSERLDAFNGLLLLPNYDKLFDKGYISFDFSGKILISKFLNPDERKILCISKSTSLVKIDERHKKFLEYHQNNRFMG